jgi:hypothetical protein
MPDGPCGVCGHPLTWVEDWPVAGQGRWLCLRCAARPTVTLAEAYDTLNPDERARLEDEAAAGDDLAREIVNLLEAAAPRRRA